MIRKMQIKPTIRMAILKNLQTINAEEDVEKRETFGIVGGNVN